jgi:hypothetical protein
MGEKVDITRIQITSQVTKTDVEILTNSIILVMVSTIKKDKIVLHMDFKFNE